jgi:release factor glutamine methyltransferase
MDADSTWTAKRERFVLPRLREELARIGYGDFCASFNPLVPRIELWRRRVALLDDPLRAVAELFLLGGSVSVKRLGPNINRIAESLCQLKILCIRDHEAYCQGLVLRVFLGLWYFTERPQINPTVYFGDDSMALLLRLNESGRESCLDLCSGPGIQALWAGRQGCRTIGVEINPFAAAVGYLNVALNGLDDRVSIECGDLYEPVRGQVFDWIIANPPLLPIPNSVPYPFVGNGGPDGMRVTRRILAHLPEFLSEHGVAQIIGTCLSDAVLPSIVDELQRYAESNRVYVKMTALAHRNLADGSQLVASLAYTAAGGDANATGIMRQKLEASFADRWASLCPFFLRIDRAATGKFDLLDLSLEGDLGFWYV